MVQKNLIFGFVLILSIIFSFPFILAEEDGNDDFDFYPKIAFTGSPDSVYVVKITDALTAKGIKSIALEIGQTGEGESEFGTNSEMVNIVIFKITNRSDFLDPGNIISEKNVGTFATNETILLDIVGNRYNALTFEGAMGTAPIDYTPQTTIDNATDEVNETAEVINDTNEENDNSLTGQAVSNTTISKTTIIYFVIGLVVIAGAVVFFMMRKNFHFGDSNRSVERTPRTIKLSELKGQAQGLKLDSAEKRLARAEHELKTAQNEISRIKNAKHELSDAEEQFRKAKERLDALKGDGFD